jgi:hypothetical protein
MALVATLAIWLVPSASSPSLAQTIAPTERRAARAARMAEGQRVKSTSQLASHTPTSPAPFAVQPKRGAQSGGTAAAAPTPLGMVEPPFQPGAQLAQTIGNGCQQITDNPPLDNNAGWYTFAGTVFADDLVTHSPGRAYRMIERNGLIGTYSGVPAIVSSFAQPIYFPPDAESMIVQFDALFRSIGSYPFANPDNPVIPYDKIWFEFYAYDFFTGGRGAYINSFYLTYNGSPALNSWLRGDFELSAGTLGSNFAPLLQTLKNQQYLWFAVTIVGDGNVQPGQELDVNFDNVRFLTCDTPAVPSNQIDGQFSGAANLLGTNAVLSRIAKDGFVEQVDQTYADASGNFVFNHAANLEDGEVYQVLFFNEEQRADLLGFWSTPESANGSASFGTIDISNVALNSPDNYNLTPFPITLNWQPRSVLGDIYYACVYQIDDLNQLGCSDGVSTGQVVLNDPNNTGFFTSDDLPFTMALNQDYAWFVVVENDAGFGYSYFANAFEPIASARIIPNDPKNPDPQPPPSAGQKAWTVLVYMAGDNDLGDPTTCDSCDPPRGPVLQTHFQTLKNQANTVAANVNIVTLTDFFGNTGTELCELTTGAAPDCRQLGEKNTADPATLRDFIQTGIANFPAQRIMLIIEDHGHSVYGVANDETTSRTASMKPQQLRQALTDGLNGRKLDLLFFNNCLMGSFEQVSDAALNARFMVGSADVRWMVDIYGRLLPLLTPSTSTADLARNMVRIYGEQLAVDAPTYFRSVAAYDLSQLSAVKQQFDTLAAGLEQMMALETARNTLVGLRNQMQPYDSSGNLLHGPEDGFVDLGHMAQLIGNTMTLPNQVTTPAQALIGALDSLVIANDQKTGDNGSGGQINLDNAIAGLAIFFPSGDRSSDQTTLTGQYLNDGIYGDFVASTEWDDVAQLYINNSTSVVAGPGRPIRAGPGRPIRAGPGRPIRAGVPISGALRRFQPIYLPITLR